VPAADRQGVDMKVHLTIIGLIDVVTGRSFKREVHDE
jgi:hypothetical protein